VWEADEGPLLSPCNLHGAGNQINHAWACCSAALATLCIHHLNNTNLLLLL